MNDFMTFILFVCLIAFGSWAFGTLYYKDQILFKQEADSIIAECQKSLPRDRHCKLEMKAVIVEMDK